jgi:hypothetical protein
LKTAIDCNNLPTNVLGDAVARAMLKMASGEAGSADQRFSGSSGTATR